MERLEDTMDTAPLLAAVKSDRKSRRKCRTEYVALSLLALVVLTLHVVFVLQLRKTTFSLHQLTIPDMCHEKSNGDIIVDFANPSYCSPRIGDIQVVVSNNGTDLLQLSIPRFTLQPGKTTVVSMVEFMVMASPVTVHDLVFEKSGSYHIRGEVVVHIYCLLVPFSITLDLSSLPSQQKSISSPDRRFKGFDGDMIKKELDRLVRQILKTIALSHVHTESTKTALFAFTDVEFAYSASVIWNIPALLVNLETDKKSRILQAGVKPFLLGNGRTFISAFSEIYKNETDPMQAMIQSYLSGNDVGIHVSGGNEGSSCLSLQLLNLIDVPVKIPAKIDGKPALVRYYSVQPMLKELNSKTHTCLLELDVEITLHNPLPIHFELFELSFDILFRNSSASASMSQLLTRIDDRSVVSWNAHDVRNVSLVSNITDFGVCKGMIDLYVKDMLVFSLERGQIRMAAGSGNLTIPFHVEDIPIHPENVLSFS